MHLQGPVPLDDGDYAERPFELDLVRQIQAGRWVLLLGPRQHGKTSALLRLRRTLNENATPTAMVDLQAQPPFTAYAQLTTWFARKVASALRHDVVIDETDDLSAALTCALPAGAGPVVVLIDEASTIDNDQWRNSFFGQLRAISSERAAADDGHIAKRLRFVFAGTFRPERLVAEANSPFNICERIDTADLVVNDIQRLAERGGLANPPEVATMIHEAVGGQPYLVQRLIQAILGTDDPQAAIAAEADRLSTSDHISNLFRRVLGDAALSGIVSSAATGQPVPLAAGNEDQRFLVVLGVMERRAGNLHFRNRLYAHMATSSPQFSQVAAPVARRAVLFPLELTRFQNVTDTQLREIAYAAQKGAVGAYRNGSCRIALAGFGTALEAVLMDFLKRQTAADLAVAAAARLNPKNFEVSTDPTSWNLNNLMRGARGLLNLGTLDIPENLREWRNLIHPGVCIKAYRPDSAFVPEVGVAAHQLDIILRDLP
ncbi:AAA-like domain-containing protein [Mitsuaria sp. PDC51]|uniref:AAA-like domain-containing protein n=1 Tax=Mitsuaria sp. PDC51 TaxID=1881035 RepID=UPI0008E6467C|nr:AAA-like domain-containing protein [Mitsuaria sp. PDC51]SFR77094.1 AAA-like domain-containing protein [Mitsuaria sp. PDC51]